MEGYLFDNEDAMISVPESTALVINQTFSIKIIGKLAVEDGIDPIFYIEGVSYFFTLWL